MTFWRKNKTDILMAGLLVVVVIAFFHRILFTDQIIRSSDVITQYFWTAKAFKAMSLMERLTSLPQIFSAQWGLYANGGYSLEGGWNANYLLLHDYLLLHFLPFPASIAWLAVLSLLWGGLGTYAFCRRIGIPATGAVLAGIVYALSAENVTLINAGHIQKIEAISWFPWILFCFERALTGGRLYHYALTSLLLGIQFFNMHWQISFYSCLAVASYWIFYMAARQDDGRRPVQHSPWRNTAKAAVMMVLFFTTISMSFAPLFSWSKQSERAGGMSYEEGMSWSLPPEELLTYIAPGLAGYSRQEAGDKPAQNEVFYWGRMHFSQTTDYLGLLPLILAPLAFLSLRNRHTWFFGFLASSTLLMALGKYTLIYRAMFEHLPGFSTFRVPKMILFLFVFAIAVLAGKGMEALLENRNERRVRLAVLTGCGMLATIAAGLWLWLNFGSSHIFPLVQEWITLPTRYQQHPGLIQERYTNMIHESRLALIFIAAMLLLLMAWFKGFLSQRQFIIAACGFLLFDLWRVNDRFLVLINPPEVSKEKAKNEVVRFLEGRIGTYRVQPIDEENAFYYSEYNMGTISAYVTVTEKRYKEFLEAFSLVNRMPDMVNLKYLVMPSAGYQSQKNALDTKYTPVFTSSTGSVVLENRTVLPKAWLVSQAIVEPDQQRRLSIMNSSPFFDPGRLALVETRPPIPLIGAANPGDATVTRYQSNQIDVTVRATTNALLVLGEKYYRWWYAEIDGKKTEIIPVNHILRGVYVPAGDHKVEFRFDPLPFKVGKYLTLASLALFAGLFMREWFLRRRTRGAV